MPLKEIINGVQMLEVKINTEPDFEGVESYILRRLEQEMPDFLESHKYHTSYGKTFRESAKRKRIQEIISKLSVK